MIKSEAFKRYPNITPHVVAALPSCDAEPISARRIFEQAGYGSINSIRIILSTLEHEGFVISKDGPPYGNRNIPAKLWRLAGYRPPHNISEATALFIAEVV